MFIECDGLLQAGEIARRQGISDVNPLDRCSPPWPRSLGVRPSALGVKTSDPEVLLQSGLPRQACWW